MAHENVLKLKELIRNCLCALSLSQNASPPITCRNVTPFALTTANDARGDAVSLLVEKMVHSQLPLCSAYILAYDFVDIFADQLHTGRRNSPSDNLQIDASNWCIELKECFAQYLQQILDGSHSLPSLSFPAECEAFPLSICALKNRKPKMEDRHLSLPSLAVVEPNFSKLSSKKADESLFAVFDGHNGSECATFASAHLAECLFDAFEESDDVDEVLNDAFDRLDKRITAKCKNENIKSGTTVSCVYYLKSTNTAYLAWCGDSAIGVLRDTTVDTLSTPHKPEDEDEMKRIEQAGGMVVSIRGVPRLNGVLNLSRSLGDILAKPMVSPVPDVKRVELSAENDHILFLATDGVWDAFEEEEIFDLCRQFIGSRPPKDFELLAEFIADEAKRSGATDNLTLICVFLRPIDALWTKFRN